MRIDHVACEVADLDASVRFYVERLGFVESWQHRNEEEGEACAFLKLGDVYLELLAKLDGSFTSSAAVPPYCPHLALAVEDLDASAEALVRQGVPILRGPLEVPGEVRWLYFADPDHNVIEYVQWIKRSW
ncbi:MAG: VOC family protein [Planctomycetota bacterium]|nr:MAG: VOC family protein [Planctomycetota bacterium]REJ89411.1 MAG: VOC family protein [Planctomycetota bacterium]REK26209.1 MAG: VOC family protein [Planctomycetota bacterium]REK44541.1 MAG: VOC family protein [Planctomycetota bacterium]